MDNTKLNILMCEKAVEIQEAWKPSVGDFSHNPKYNINFVVRSVHGNFDGCIWLPRQDQLQEIWIKGHTYAADCIIFQFNRWFNNNKNDLVQFNSMEQLWLAFVMKELYNKVWNGNDWIKND